MKKLVIIFIMLFALTYAKGQVSKVKIKKEKTCSYKVNIDKELVDKTLTVAQIGFSGIVSESSRSTFRETLNLYLSEKVVVKKDNFEVMFVNICRIENYFLKEINIIPIKKSKNDFSISFVYSEIK